MSRAPIEMMLDGVMWKAVTHEGNTNHGKGLYATHEGVFEIDGVKMRCYRLSNGQAVFNADDFEAFFDSINVLG